MTLSPLFQLAATTTIIIPFVEKSRCSNTNHHLNLLSYSFLPPVKKTKRLSAFLCVHQLIFFFFFGFVLLCAGACRNGLVSNSGPRDAQSRAMKHNGMQFLLLTTTLCAFSYQQGLMLSRDLELLANKIMTTTCYKQKEIISFFLSLPFASQTMFVLFCPIVFTASTYI